MPRRVLSFAFRANKTISRNEHIRSIPCEGRYDSSDVTGKAGLSSIELHILRSGYSEILSVDDLEGNAFALSSCRCMK